MKQDPRRPKPDRGHKGSKRPPPPTRRVLAIVAEVAAEHDAEVLEQSLTQSRVLKLVVDREAGVETGFLVGLIKGLRRALVDAGIDPGEYQIEVDSPGAERVLRTARHFERFAGMEIRVRRAGDKERMTLLGAEGDRPKVRDGDGEERVLAAGDYDEIRLVGE